jgi:[CysO sulfur-carrier protein]-S-L-cysteine hydrolase
MIKEKTIQISKAIVTDMVEHLRSDLPNEGCGYLSGTDDEVKTLHKMTNIDKSPEHFTFDPKEQFAVVKEARSKNEQLLAVYHSHPETPARLSEEDITLFNDPNMVYIIVSFKEEDPEVKGYMVNKPSDDEIQIRRITIEIKEN